MEDHDDVNEYQHTAEMEDHDDVNEYQPPPKCWYEDRRPSEMGSREPVSDYLIDHPHLIDTNDVMGEKKIHEVPLSEFEEMVEEQKAFPVPVDYELVEDRYWVDVEGNIYSVRPMKKHPQMVKRLTPWINRDGYRQVGLYKRDKTRKRLLVHRLVYESAAAALIAPGYEIDHLDSDPANNKLDNLEAVTRDENIARSKRARVPVKGREIGYDEWAEFDSQSHAARVTGCDAGHIGQIVNGGRHTAGSKISGRRWTFTLK